MLRRAILLACISGQAGKDQDAASASNAKKRNFGKSAGLMSNPSERNQTKDLSKMKLSKLFNSTSTSKRLPTFIAPLLLAASGLLASCGGGGSDSGPCGGGGDLRLDLTYEVNGQLVDSTLPVTVTRGLPLLATPKALGLPAACAGDARFTFSARSDVPAGLNFDTSTGVISGTPTARANFSVDLRLSVIGYTADVRRTVLFFM